MNIYYVNDIPKELADKVEDHILSQHISWVYRTTTIENEEVKYEKPFTSTDYVVSDHPLFCSMMYWAKQPSPWINVISDLSDYLIDHFNQNLIYEQLGVGRILANLTVPTKSAEGTIQLPHRDCAPGRPYYSFLYYPTNSDGDTYFFDEDDNLIARASPVKGTGVLFSSDMTHAGSLPINSARRIAINFMFERLKFFS